MKPLITHDTEITDATISGFMRSDGIVEWDINIECGTIDVDGHESMPRLYIEKLKWDIHSIEELLNKSISINDGSEFCNNMILPGVPLCCLYVFEHDYINGNEINFYSEEDELYIKWSGHSEEYEVNLDTSIEFLGINLGDIEVEDAKKLLKFDSAGLCFYKEDGVLYLIQE